MKLAIVTQDELNEIWDILQPMNRFFIGEGISGAAIRITDTLVVVGAEVITFQQAIDEALAANVELKRRREVRRDQRFIAGAENVQLD